MPKKTLEPKQARSRESLRKLLQASAEVLGQHGVEGATIPRIAQHAGLTPGAVYRRFPDKDGLLETVILGILERQADRVRAIMTPALAAQIPLTVLAEQVMNDVVVNFRAHAGLIRALRQFLQARPHTPFWKKATRLETGTFVYVVNLFLVHRREIKHPDPRAAVSLAFMMAISTLRELVVAPANWAAWNGLLPKNDQALKRELTLAFLSYLGVEPGATARLVK